MPGVRSANVSFAEEHAVVEYEPERATVDDLVAAVKAQGYQSWNTTEEKKRASGPEDRP